MVVTASPVAQGGDEVGDVVGLDSGTLEDRIEEELQEETSMIHNVNGAIEKVLHASHSFI